MFIINTRLLSLLLLLLNIFAHIKIGASQNQTTSPSSDSFNSDANVTIIVQFSLNDKIFLEDYTNLTTQASQQLTTDIRSCITDLFKNITFGKLLGCHVLQYSNGSVGVKAQLEISKKSGQSPASLLQEVKDAIQNDFQNNSIGIFRNKFHSAMTFINAELLGVAETPAPSSGLSLPAVIGGAVGAFLGGSSMLTVYKLVKAKVYDNHFYVFVPNLIRLQVKSFVSKVSDAPPKPEVDEEPDDKGGGKEKEEAGGGETNNKDDDASDAPRKILTIHFPVSRPALNYWPRSKFNSTGYKFSRSPGLCDQINIYPGMSYFEYIRNTPGSEDKRHSN